MYSVDGPAIDFIKNIFEPGIRIYIVEFAGAQQAVDHSQALSSLVTAGK